MKTHHIENQYLKIGVKQVGAELCSILNKRTGTEHIWQADPDIWSSHAPNLFPVIGVLKDGKYLYEGVEYEMPKHGFVRHNKDVSLKHSSENYLNFLLTHSGETRKIYPFKFQFEITFKLKDKNLEVSHKVSNLDEKIMYFSLGGHPAFNAPLQEDEEYEDYYLEFDRKMKLDSLRLGKKGLVSKKTKTILDKEDKIQLNRHLFDKDALIFREIPSKKVSLKSQKLGEVLTVEYSDFKNLGIWAKPGAPFVCIEPWLGIADFEDTDQNIESKKDILKLEPGEDFRASYNIHLY